MHRSLRLPSKRAAAVGALLLALLLVVISTAAGAQGGGDDPNAVETVPVERGSVIARVSADGHLDSPSEIPLNFERSGRLVDVAVEEGDRVYRGDVLARIDGGPARASLRAARSNLASARANLADTRAGRTLLERERNDRLADQSRVAVDNAGRDVANARKVVAANAGGLRRAARRARIGGELATLRASEVRLARERVEVDENLTRFRRLESLLDRLRADLDRLRDQRRDRTNAAQEATSRRSRLESDLAAARERQQAAAKAVEESRQAGAEACQMNSNSDSCTEAMHSQREAEDDQRDADNELQQRQDELDDAERDALESTQVGNNLDFAIQVLETRIMATETDDARAKQDLETSKATVRQYTTEVTSNRTALREARRRLGAARDNLINGIARARQQVDQARSSLASSEGSLGVTLASGRVDEQPAKAAQLAAGRAAVASSESSVKDARKALSDTVLRAPTDGVAGRVNGEVGDLVGVGGPAGASSQAGSGDGSPAGGAGAPSSGGGSGSGGGSAAGGASGGQGGSGGTAASPPSGGGAGGGGSPAGGSTGSPQAGGVVTLAQVDPLELKVNFSENDAARLHSGDQAQVVVDPLPSKRIAAHVASVDPIETTVNGVVTYEVTMLLDQDVDGLKPGMSATADVVVARADHTLTVPRTAVRSPEGANPSVTVVGPGGRQELRLVATGVQSDSNVQILAGIGLGDRVVRTIAAPPDPGAAQ